MGSLYSTSEKIQEYTNEPPGCILCPEGSTPGNPGTFEDIHKKFENLDPKAFEGARIVLLKKISKHFHVIHRFNINSNSKPFLLASNQLQEENGYKFEASYTGIKKVGNTEKYPILYGDINPNGHSTATFIHTLGCRCRVKLFTRAKQNRFLNSKATIEYRSDDFTSSITLVDPNLLKLEGILVLHYLQAITSRITLGFEFAYNTISSCTEGSRTHIAGAFRYSTGFRTLSTTIGQAGVRICYHHKQSPQLQMGIEIQTNLIKNMSRCKILYQLNVPQADLIFRGFVDTDWKIGGVFEKKLYPIPEASLALSGILDHIEQSVRVGIGLNIE
jgi:mitochondrial import receptor subunit TOM40